MNVTVYAPMGSSSMVGVNADNRLDLPDDAVVGDIFKVMTIPDSLCEMFVCTVNNRPQAADTPLREGDTVRFTFPYAGG